MSDPPSIRSFRWRRWVLSLLAMAALGGLFLIVRGQRLPPLTRQHFDTAKTRWADAKLLDYQIEITVAGRQPGVYAVNVEQGIATQATLNSRALTRPRTFGTWSVDGMFETLARDLETQDKTGNLILGAEFEASTGIPLRYERMELQTGQHDTLQWEVTRFQTPAAPSEE